MSEVKVNKISPRTNCGTTTLGDSGDSFVIPSGVTITNNGTQTGFGRTGTVDWQTSIKTSTFTAASGEGYFVNTTGGAVTVNLPAGSVGAIVSIKDYAQTFDTNNCTISADGSEKIENLTTDLILDTEGSAVTLIYADATRGWQAVNSNEITNTVKFIAATGGTITTSGDFKIHTFTGPGTFEVTCAGNAAGSNKVSYMVVAGGGGGGFYGGGAGAGGYREGKASFCAPYTASPLACTSGPNAGLAVPVQSYPITVGGGGAGGSGSPNPGAKGNNSVFSTITSTGGGFGGAGPANAVNDGGPGGSGGAGAPRSPSGGNPPGTGNTPPVSPSQGNNGGNSHHEPGVYQLGGGGGGAGAVGTSISPAGPGATSAGAGGAGTTSSINASPVTRAGGGGGGSDNGPRPGGAGGSGGGGAGGRNPSPQIQGVAGTANTGGGGGAGGGGGSACGAAGGSGIVIIRYKFQ
tara:strand:- start:78 stop:1466 length:1389 start_codon:yes stop_codon:yes gene_type:complete